MASSYFRQFAIDNHLTVDYGYMYGVYRDFYISLRESLGSTKILTITTQICNDLTALKEILSVFNEDELPKYCITDMKRDESYIQFTFEIGNDKCKLIHEFLDKFIDSYASHGHEALLICPICHNPIGKDEKIVTIDISGILTPAHEHCYEKGKEEVEKKAKEEKEKLNKDTKGYRSGLLGAIVYGLIYFVILIISFFFVQFILNNITEGNEDADFARIFQYFPALVCLAACPIITAGYDQFKGKKGTQKYIIILWVVIISTLLGTFLGFVAGLLALPGISLKFGEILKLVIQLISGSYPTFRWGFYVYIIAGLGLSILSMVFKFSGKKEMEEANKGTFEKLD